MKYTTGGGKLLPILFFTIWALVLFHMVAEYFYWYWIYRWLDIPVHFFGGAWVGLASVYIQRTSSILQHKTAHIHTLIVMVAGAFLFGVCWELYEFGVWWYMGTGLPKNYYGDTFLDLCMDILGALGAYGVYRFARHTGK